MRHKFNNKMPSLGWINAYLKKYINRRLKCVLIDDHWMMKPLLEKEIFIPDQPIIMNAIFEGARKQAPDKLDYVSHQHTILNFGFRDILFEQGDKVAWIVWKTREENKKRSWYIPYNEFKGGGVLDLGPISSMLPVLFSTSPKSIEVLE